MGFFDRGSKKKSKVGSFYRCSKRHKRLPDSFGSSIQRGVFIMADNCSSYFNFNNGIIHNNKKALRDMP